MSKTNTAKVSENSISLSIVPKLKPIKRWTVAKKAELLDMLLSYKVEAREVLDFYPDISTEELLDWRDSYQRFGRAGLRTTKTQKYKTDSFRKAA